MGLNFMCQRRDSTVSGSCRLLNAVQYEDEVDSPTIYSVHSETGERYCIQALTEGVAPRAAEVSAAGKSQISSR